jgi:hypothetical protein
MQGRHRFVPADIQSAHYHLTSTDFGENRRQRGALFIFGGHVFALKEKQFCAQQSNAISAVGSRRSGFGDRGHIGGDVNASAILTEYGRIGHGGGGFFFKFGGRLPHSRAAYMALSGFYIYFASFTIQDHRGVRWEFV